MTRFLVTIAATVRWSDTIEAESRDKAIRIARENAPMGPGCEWTVDSVHATEQA